MTKVCQHINLGPAGEGPKIVTVKVEMFVD